MNPDHGPKYTEQYPEVRLRYKTMWHAMNYPKDFYEDFKKRLKLAISKFKSSVKTRAVHRLVENNIISIKIITSDIKARPPFAIDIKDKTLRQIYIDMTYVDDSVGSKTLPELIGELVQNRKKYREEKKLISDLQIYKIKKLDEEYEELKNKIMDSIDWIKVVDIAYFAYLATLSYLAVNKNNPEKVKIFATAEELLYMQIKKVFMQVDKEIFEDPIQKNNFRLGLQYFILTYYLQIDKKRALNILASHKGEWVEAALADLIPEEDDEKYESPDIDKEEYRKRLFELREKKESLKKHYENLRKELQKTRIEHFDDLVIILNILEVVNITKTQFNHLMEKAVGGQDIYLLYYQDYFRFIALMANLNYRTQIFPKQFEVDSELQKKMEQLILNQQRVLVIKKRNLI